MDISDFITYVDDFSSYDVDFVSRLIEDHPHVFERGEKKASNQWVRLVA